MSRRAALLLALVLATPGGESAVAQLQLPGAVAPTPQGATTPQGRPTGPRAPGDAANPLAARGVPASTLRRWEEALPGRTLRFLGQHGALVISRAGTPAQPSYTIAATGVIGRRGNDIRNICTPDLGGGRPVPLKPLGRPDGLPRFEANFTGCTITLDLMADAAFVAAPGGACSFDDCVVDPAGLWGPNDREIPRDSEIERARGVAERRLNDARRILQARLRTTPEGRQFLQEQAGFPANRERLCRNYGTTDIGPAFCALKFTEARAENLAARVGGPPSDAPPRRPVRPRPPPAPVPQQ